MGLGTKIVGMELVEEGAGAKTIDSLEIIDFLEIVQFV